MWLALHAGVAFSGMDVREWLILELASISAVLRLEVNVREGTLAVAPDLLDRRHESNFTNALFFANTVFIQFTTHMVFLVADMIVDQSFAFPLDGCVQEMLFFQRVLRVLAYQFLVVVAWKVALLAASRNAALAEAVV